MERSRRSFLKIAGICALGLGAKSTMELVWPGRLDAFEVSRDPEALEAKQWAMVIDMKKCWEKGKEDCKDCLLACHRVHNVPDIGNIKEEIKWIWTEPFDNAFPGWDNEHLTEGVKGKNFIVLCNHCTNPPCVRVCPTKATFKRPENGIVMMDYHRCIGCRYCMAGCPYGARSFNFRDPAAYIDEATINMTYPRRERGVVEKCNFCDERLAKGLMPACVEACKPGALVFGDITDPESNVRKLLRTHFSIRRKPELGTQPNAYYLI